MLLHFLGWLSVFLSHSLTPSIPAEASPAGLGVSGDQGLVLVPLCQSLLVEATHPTASPTTLLWQSPSS